MPIEIQIYEVQFSFFQLSFNNKRKPERSALCEDFIERTSRPHELVNPETLEVSANSTPTLCRTLTVEVNPESLSFDLQELSNIHELYAKMKTAVTASSEQAVSSIDLIRKNLVPELHGTVMDFYKWQQSGVGHFWRERLNIAFFFFFAPFVSAVVLMRCRVLSGCHWWPQWGWRWWRTVVTAGGQCNFHGAPAQCVS